MIASKCMLAMISFQTADDLKYPASITYSYRTELPYRQLDCTQSKSVLGKDSIPGSEHFCAIVPLLKFSDRHIGVLIIHLYVKTSK